MRRGGEQKKYSGGQGRTHSFTFFFRVWGRGGRGKKREMGRPSARRRRRRRSPPVWRRRAREDPLPALQFFFRLCRRGPPLFSLLLGEIALGIFVAQFFFALSDPPLLHRGRRCFPPLFGDRRRKRGALSAFLIASRWGRKGTPPPHSCAKAHFKRSRRKRGVCKRNSSLSFHG